MKYPLEQLATIKQKRLEEAEKVLKERKESLTKAENFLKDLADERDKTLRHRDDKEAQFYEDLSKGTTSDKIEIAKRYLKVVEEDLKKREKKVVDQQKIVDKAKEDVEHARKDLLKKQQDVEKIKLHRKEWEKEMERIEIQKEGIEADEMGTSMHIRRKKEKDHG